MQINYIVLEYKGKTLPPSSENRVSISSVVNYKTLCYRA